MPFICIIYGNTLIFNKMRRKGGMVLKLGGWVQLGPTKCKIMFVWGFEGPKVWIGLKPINQKLHSVNSDHASFKKRKGLPV